MAHIPDSLRFGRSNVPSPSSNGDGTPVTPEPGGPTKAPLVDPQLQQLLEKRPGTPAASDSTEDLSQRGSTERRLEAGLLRAAPEVSSLDALCTVLGVANPTLADGTQDGSHGASSLEQADAHMTLMALVNGGTVRDLTHSSPMRVIKKLLERVEAFSDHQNEAASVMLGVIEDVHPVARPDAMIAMSALAPSLSAPSGPLYDQIFGQMKNAHDAHERWKQLRSPLARPASPSAGHNPQATAPLQSFQIDDHAYSRVLTDRIRTMTKLDPQRHQEEVQKVLKEIASLEPGLQVAPLKVLAEELGNLDEQAVTPALFEAILEASKRIFDADKSGTTAYDGRDVLPPLASATAHLRDAIDRLLAFDRVLAMGVRLRDRRAVDTLVNLLPTAKTFSGDGSDSVTMFAVLDLLDTMSDHVRAIDFALIGAPSNVVPQATFEYVFDRALVRLMAESESRPLGRDEARARELRTLIEAQGRLENETERDVQFRRLGALVGTAPLEHRPSLSIALRAQSHLLPRERQGGPEA